MKWYFSITALFFVVAFSACQKELSIDNGGVPGGNTAQYSLAGGTGGCTGAVLSGTYIQGIDLTTTNTVTLQVTVGATGSWSIVTNTVNGISFSGSGTFDSTGTQTITLLANGTPAAAGNFTFTTGSTSCTFIVTVSQVNQTAFDYYFDVTVDGERFERHATDTDTTYIVHYGYEYNVGDSDIIFESGIVPYEDPAPLNMPHLLIRKGIFEDYDTASDGRKKAFFAPAVYPFAIGSDLNGIEIIWVDKDNKTWSSRNAPGDQAGSNFTITTIEDFTGPFGDYTFKFNATFNCKLYDDTGSSITLTNGRYFNEMIP